MATKTDGIINPSPKRKIFKIISPPTKPEVNVNPKNGITQGEKLTNQGTISPKRNGLFTFLLLAKLYIPNNCKKPKRIKIPPIINLMIFTYEDVNITVKKAPTINRLSQNPSKVRKSSLYNTLLPLFPHIPNRYRKIGINTIVHGVIDAIIPKTKDVNIPILYWKY